jgi:uncharacterized protein YkwD
MKGMRIWTVVLACLGCLALVGCGREMESFSAWAPEIVFEAGSGWEGEIPLDSQETELSLESVTGGGFAASLDGNTLVLEAQEAGNFSVTLSAKAPGYRDASLTLPVTVEPREMTVFSAWTPEILLEAGSVWEGEIPLDNPESQLAVSEVSLSGMEAVISQGILTVEAEEAGSGTITVTAQAPGYRDASLTLPVTVVWGTASPGLSQTSLTLETGESTTLPLSPTSGAVLEVTQVTEGLEAVLEGDSLTLTGKTSGNFSVTLSAKAQDWLDGSQTLEITVEDPAPESAAPSGGASAQPLPDVDTSTYAADAAEIIRLTNEYREENGLEPLEHLSTVDILATIRAREAGESWSHTRPNGEGFETVFSQYGILYRGYGENLFSVNTSYTPEEVVQAWKDSPGHNENLLRPQFDGIGVGVCKVGEYYYYCQLFAQY